MPFRAMHWALCLLSFCTVYAHASDRLTYIYREAAGTILYTNIAPHEINQPGYELVGTVKLPKPRTITAAQAISTASGIKTPVVGPQVSCGGLSNKALAERERRYTPLIQKYASRYGMDESLIKAVVSVESCFDANAVSHAGARGLMQLMPSTAKYLGVRDSFDSEQNLQGGIKYLSQLMRQFDRDELALAAYNAGPGAVNKYNGIPPFKETQKYVKKVLSRYRTYQANDRG